MASQVDGTVPWLVDDTGSVVGFKRNNGTEGYIAQLATDAAGVSVGLSGGSPASGVAFGPPATIFRLRMRCSGGASTVTLIATKRSGGSESFAFSLASGDDVSESIFASDYSSLVWYSAGAGTVTVEVI